MRVRVRVHVQFAFTFVCSEIQSVPSNPSSPSHPKMNNKHMYLGQHFPSPQITKQLEYSHNNGSWFALVTTSNFPLVGLYPSHPQPEPWMAAVAALSFFLRPSSPPKSLSMACLRGPSLRAPPPALVGARFFQKRVWFIWPVSERKVICLCWRREDGGDKDTYHHR